MWTGEMFQVNKPVIALLHLMALPGAPLSDDEAGMQYVIKMAGEELDSLQDGGVDGILISNEFSLPYQKKVSYITVAAMARIIGALEHKFRVPFGVNIAYNPMEALELAVATEAKFIRAAFTGAYMGESGLVDTDIAEVIRRRKQLNAEHVRMLYKVNPESDAYLAPRDLQTITKSIVFHCFPDGLCVSGSGAGKETNADTMTVVKEAAGDVPIFCNTGCNHQNVIEKLEVSDGLCVGTAFKKDGKFANYVDIDRVIDFMNKVREYRNRL